MIFTGPAEVLRQDQLVLDVLIGFELSKKHFETVRARRRNGWTGTLCAGSVTSRKRSAELRIQSTKGTTHANTQICRPGRTKWFLKHFNESFKTCQEYMLWLGKAGEIE
ncbi:hypothetical protein DER44DRAFT_753742 [Fusarium oxysporum]|nr:hypothetical protein DER44DRAFT_753742 [Fusarium oxysporum]